MNIENYFDKGTINTVSSRINAEEIDFSKHPKFKGVSLKHLVTGKLTNNQISCHLVKVEPFCILDTHVHESSLEIHEIISGDGTCYIGENKVNYRVGTVGVIPANTPHKVEAGANGIYILAKFTPALL
ncbi:cupin domain-containing protein [Clostridium thailandense]|uniref:cupin domain-containing protein n=1 Tax=Clostridium thailandense TaxID=2794346 RepID=UPI00398A2E3C